MTRKQDIWAGSGCGSVGWAVTSNTRGPQFESSHKQNLYWTFIYCQLYWKDKNKEKEAHFRKQVMQQQWPLDAFLYQNSTNHKILIVFVSWVLFSAGIWKLRCSTKIWKKMFFEMNNGVEINKPGQYWGCDRRTHGKCGICDWKEFLLLFLNG